MLSAQYLFWHTSSYIYVSCLTGELKPIFTKYLCTLRHIQPAHILRMFTTHKFPEQYLRRLDPCLNVRKLMAQIRSEFPNFLAAEISQPGQMPSKGGAAPAPVLDNFGAGVSVKCTGSPVLENLVLWSLSHWATEPVHQSFSSGQSWQWVGRSGTRVTEYEFQKIASAMISGCDNYPTCLVPLSALRLQPAFYIQVSS